MTVPWQRSLKSMRKFAGAGARNSGRSERCELCAAALARRHQHLIDPRTRELVCSCEGCAILFDGAGATKYRRIPRRVERLHGFKLEGEDWARLLVPIGLAFFYHSSHANRVVALYPSPAGVTEAVIEPEDWLPISKANPRLGRLREDVEALLVHRLRDNRDYFIAPIDRCFELAGIVRRHWRGFSGGDRVWSEVSSFLSELEVSAR